MKLLFALILAFSFHIVSAQYDYEASSNYPYGRWNPEAPTQLKDFELLIGKSDCSSIARVDQNTWADTVQMTWVFKYIMNGKAVQDETLKADGTHSGSIRQFNSDSSKWYVHYYTSAAAVATLPSWEGGKKTEDIVLYREQPSPNGSDGYYRLTFLDIEQDSFNWEGAWVSPDESIVYPTWKIFCEKTDP